MVDYFRNIPVEVRTDCPPGVMYLINKSSMEFQPTSGAMLKLRKRKWWQFWKPKHPDLVGNFEVNVDLKKSMPRRSGELKPVPQMPKDFVGWTDSEGNVLQ